MINTHDSEVLVKNIVKIRLKNRDGRRYLQFCIILSTIIDEMKTYISYRRS